MPSRDKARTLDIGNGESLERQIWESKGGSLFNFRAAVINEELQPGTNGGFPWFAVRVKSNYEKSVSATLRGKGFEEFAPMYSVERRWSDRVKTIDVPLFPGYLFCRLDLNKRQPLLTTPGFLYLVGKGRTPEPVDESEILAIQAVMRSGLPALPWPALVVGQRVSLERGPLRGVEGVVAKVADQDRIYLNATLLHRSIFVEVRPEWVRPVGNSSPVLAA
jgi:transcription antitermination factor NusG